MSSLFCKTCLASNVEIIPLKNKKIVDMVEECTSIKIMHIFEYICTSCLSFILQFNAFKEKAIALNKIYAECVSKSIDSKVFLSKNGNINTFIYSKCEIINVLNDQTGIPGLEKVVFSIDHESFLPKLDSMLDNVHSIPANDDNTKYDQNNDDIVAYLTDLGVLCDVVNCSDTALDKITSIEPENNVEDSAIKTEESENLENEEFSTFNKEDDENKTVITEKNKKKRIKRKENTLVNKPYSCHKCKAKYFRKRMLFIHLKNRHYKDSEEKSKIDTVECKECNLHLNISEVEGHNEIEHKTILQCQLCKMTFFAETLLDKHIQEGCRSKKACMKLMQYQKGRGQCDLCGKHINHLRSHMRHIHFPPAPKENCSECGEYFNKKSSLTKHLFRQHKICNNDYAICTFCGKSILKTGLNAHMRICPSNPVIMEKPKCFRCRYCQRVDFETMSLLREHQRQEHLEDRKNQQKPVSCQLCNKSFRNNSYLSKHRESYHTDSRPYACNFCQKTYKQKNHLQVHMRTHTNETPFNCDICFKSFTRRETLNKHYRKHIDVNNPSYPCPLCPRKFNTPYSYKVHLKHEHKSVDVLEIAFTNAEAGIDDSADIDIMGDTGQ